MFNNIISIMLRLAIFTWFAILALTCEGDMDEMPGVDSVDKYNAQIRELCNAMSTSQARIQCFEREIRQHIERYWFYPRDTPPDMAFARVKIYLDQKGNVLKSEFLESSPSHAYNMSINHSIYRAQPFPIPADEPLYTQNFSDIEITFRPSSEKNANSLKP
ncbi:MAG: TonB C-terminal domain-containing protein [Gammaproteobacteria bacterium]|nr:TonB C-terminal domain-containing protein [Gammaproteobacteria bacterium]